MPFKKMKDGTYKTPKGRRMTRRQVQAYQATDGFQRNKKHKPRRKK